MNTATQAQQIEDQVGLQLRDGIKALLAFHGHTAEDLGEVLGLKRAAMYKRLSGTTHFKAEEIAVIAWFFRIDPGTFYRGQEGLVNYLMERVTRQEENNVIEMSPAVAKMKKKKGSQESKDSRTQSSYIAKKGLAA